MNDGTIDYLPTLMMGNAINNDADFIPLISDEDDATLEQGDIPDQLPILPLRNTVLFPGVILPIVVGRDKSLKLVRDVYNKDRLLGILAQKDSKKDNPAFSELYTVGTVAQILRILEMPDGSTSIIIQGRRRFEVKDLLSSEPYFNVKIALLSDIRPEQRDREFEALVGSLKDLSLKIIRLSTNIPHEASFAVRNIDSSSFLINFISSNSDIKPEEKQSLLETNELKKRASLLLGHLSKEVQMLELKNELQTKVKTDMDQQQREYLLHQQMKTIQSELGKSPVEAEVTDLKKKAKTRKWSKEVNQHFTRELEKLERLNPAAAEYAMHVNYLQTLVDVPWGLYTKDNFDLHRAQKVLDEDHFGLDKVKDRILEYLAVLKLKGNMKSPILCLVGPPGVGKTSLGKSVARSIGRKYVRMSLGGLHDEAEIRGHRKTYIGAMPGRIIQNLRKAKSSNPVFVLDEIDKIGRDHRGDPSSALLEVLDPEQNGNFYDNYLEVDFDLSKVMFIATANTTAGIHQALTDRMEIIDVSGYILEEKVEIARQHLIPCELKAHGVKASQLRLSAEALAFVTESYTRESGVRELSKQLAKLIRSVARQIAFDEPYSKHPGRDEIRKVLGPERFIKDKYQGNEYAGVVTGLAWTAAGGEILYIETSLSKGTGKLTITGNLGDVMKESAVLALEYIKAHCTELAIDPDQFEKVNIHLHVPEGAIPKDGPSAGITMVTALASVFTRRKVRATLAMTGEITLRGKVLPVGGIREKILAARRAGITDIVICAENRKDIAEIKDIYLQGLTFRYVTDISEVLQFALLDEKVGDSPLPKTEPAKEPAIKRKRGRPRKQ